MKAATIIIAVTTGVAMAINGLTNTPSVTTNRDVIRTNADVTCTAHVNNVDKCSDALMSWAELNYGDDYLNQEYTGDNN